ncbi:MAG: VOC family protein [Vulcanimicrobiota bacterium]
MKILGIHHITAVAGLAHQNYRFHTQTLGLRMVKKTVNFDDPSVYHLYYGDQTGSPGTLLTFFPYEGARATRPGHGEVSAITYQTSESLDDWVTRVGPHHFETRFGERVLVFHDPDGIRYELVQGEGEPFGAFRSATLRVQQSGPTAELLELFGFAKLGEEGARSRYQLANSTTQLEVLEAPDLPRASGGAGSVHHIALRVADDEAQLWWRERLLEAGYQVTPVVDRNYFHSVYFRGPGGVLFELATDPPGMLIDESLDELGTNLMLPPQHERLRELLEQRLPPLEEPYRSLHKPGNQPTLLLLHGTGGDEFDLLGIAEQLDPEAAVLSLRGNVDEQGMARFFKRLRPGVFDEADLKRRSGELAELIRTRGHEHVAVGYSNGANLAAATLMLHPEALKRAVLFRPMLPLEAADKSLEGLDVLLVVGTHDTVVSPDSGRRLAEVLRQAGARVQLDEVEASHQLTPRDLELAKRWLSERLTAAV